MKIGIPCTVADNHSQLHTPFKQAPFFAFWDTATEHLEFKRNPLADKESACAYAAGRWAQKQGAEALICAAIGQHAVERLSKEGMQVLLSQAGELSAVFDSYRNSALDHELAASDSACSCGHHGHHGHDGHHGEHQQACGCDHPHDHPEQGGCHGHGHGQGRAHGCSGHHH